MRATAILRSVAGLPLVERGVLSLADRVPRRRDVLAVLTFHRVAPADGVVPGLLSATPETFGRLLDVVSDTFSVVSIEDVLERRSGGPALPARSLLLTFDDAYEDVADHVWPALASRGMPGVVFVPTGFPAEPGGAPAAFWWERAWAALRESPAASIRIAGATLSLGSAAERTAAYRAARTWLKELPHEALETAVQEIERAAGFTPDALPAPTGRALGWERLRHLHAAGLALGSHTRTHPLLTRVADDVLRREIAGGVDDLRQRTGSDVAAFAFPSGAIRAAAGPALRDAGVAVAFSTRRGVNDLREGHWLQLRRVNVSVATPLSAVLAQAVR